MIVTIKIKLGIWWSGTIEIDDSSTFEDLHYIIQKAVNFDDDHLYEFYLAKSDRSRDRDVIASYDDSDKVALKVAFPIPSGKKLFYLFDYGDNWLFQISPTRKRPFTAKSDIKYPQLVKESGEKPCQYPDWDE